MEGPAVYALAQRLHATLTASAVDRIEVPTGRWQANVLLLHCAGQVIQRVRSHGKWLFFDFSHGVTWACHLLAKANWVVASGKAGKGVKHVPLLTVHLRNGVRVVLTGRPLFLTLPTETHRRHEALSGLGADPLVTGTFVGEFLPRLRGAAHRTLASALLDQDILAGLGNPLKCELLFGLGMGPGVRVAGLLASDMDRIAAEVTILFHAAAQEAMAGRGYPYQVFDRAGEPCVRCQTPITADRSSADGHFTWYCPRCQAEESGGTLF